MLLFALKMKLRKTIVCDYPIIPLVRTGLTNQIIEHAQYVQHPTEGKGVEPLTPPVQTLKP